MNAMKLLPKQPSVYVLVCVISHIASAVRCSNIRTANFNSGSGSDFWMPFNPYLAVALRIGQPPVMLIP
jgi:hypothetical protein